MNSPDGVRKGSGAFFVVDGREGVGGEPSRSDQIRSEQPRPSPRRKEEGGGGILFLVLKIGFILFFFSDGKLMNFSRVYY